jgi:AraC-like DNA-binding protein/quercetin dioxygenase-like cupin family protein
MAYQETPATHRKLLLFNDLQVNNVVLLGSYRYTDSGNVLREHTHEGTMEICYLDKGYQTYTVGDKEYHLKGGDIFITFPGEKHGTGGYLEEKGTLYWFQVKLELEKNNFLSYQNEDAQVFLKNILGISKRHFSIGSDFKNLLDHLFTVGQEEQSSLQRIKIYSLTSQILLNILEASAGGLQNNQSDEILKAVGFIKKNIEKNISVEDLADHVHLSVSHFKNKFKTEMGTSPADFVQRQKIEKSESLLREGSKNITEIAYYLGYPSSQHFSSVFKKYTGKSPSQFKKT